MNMKAATQQRTHSEQTLLERDLAAEIQNAIDAAQNYLLKAQREDGHWYGELEGDTILESEYILTLHFIGRSGEDRARKAANYLRKKALADGGWANYPGGPADVSSSVKAYFALKLLGDDSEALHMRRARNVIRKLGGLSAVNSFTRIYLALFGQFPWNRCPAVPPELILLPQWFPINLYELSSWSRAIVVPLSVIWAFKPSHAVPEYASIDELWLDTALPPAARPGFWRNFFKMTDSVLKFLEQRHWTPWRRHALAACEHWMIEHFRNSDGIGAIFPPIINSIIALRCLGYANEHPFTQSQILELERLEIEEDETLRVAPCFSPVWDTALTSVALVESGLAPDHPALLRAGEWTLTKEVQIAGDWKFKNPEGKPGGWFFEYSNQLYPDTDDTFQVLTALSKIQFPEEADEQRKREAAQRAFHWLLTMQNKDGGWGSFDRDCSKQCLTQIPFADHNAMIDPSTTDITARGLETFAAIGLDPAHPAVRRAIDFVLKEQEADGSWFGRWGCNYLYGTWLALRGLKCVGVDLSKDRFETSARWLRSVQNPDGGWGELPRSYEDPSFKGQGPSTPSQTAWALMGLMATGDYHSLSLRLGLEYLLDTQGEDGSWHDEFWTGTGFPRVFYLRYHLYAVYFPLMALGLFGRSITS
jgi:squalene-hopene/tetraprenyl-beta-curcumene cyclase